MPLADLILLALATWYLAYILVNEDGFLGVLWRLRSIAPSHTPLKCIVCTALWAAAIVYGLFLVFPPAVYVLAAAGGALIAHKWSGWSYGK